MQTMDNDGWIMDVPDESKEETFVNWNHPTRHNVGNPSPQPPLPEPMTRLSPTGSGISLRKLPSPSFAHIRKACQFYELKTSGKYSAKTPAARYLYELSRDVQQQIVSLEKSDSAKMRRIAFLETLVKEWEEVFGSPSDEDLATFRANGSHSSIIAPAALAKLLKEQQAKVMRLEGVIETMKEEQRDDIARFESTVNDHFKISRQQYLLETNRIQKKYEDEASALRSKLTHEIEEAKRERKEMRAKLQEEKEQTIAEAVADIDRRVEDATKRGIERAKEEKSLGLAEINDIRQALQLERIRVSAELKRKEALVDDAIQRANRQHDIEISRMKANQAKLLSENVERGRSKEKATNTKVSNLRLENGWLRKRVSELQNIVEALKEAAAVATTM